jgi:curved DNA-binding protein CbpA
MADFYQVLGVLQTASGQEIKKSFRALAKRYHPDKNLGDDYADERFKQINEAYQVLSDRVRKAHYDAVLNYNHVQSIRAYQSSTVPLNNQSTEEHKGPNRIKVKPLSAAQKARIEKYRTEKYVKAFNRMAVILVFFLVGFGSVVGVIEIERADEREVISLDKIARGQAIRELLAGFETSLQSENFNLAYSYSNELILLGSSYGDVIFHKTSRAVMAKGDRSYEENDYSDAIKIYELYLINNNLHNDLLNLRIAKCYLQLGNTVAAERVFTSTCENLLVGYVNHHGENYYYSMNPEYLAGYHFEAFLGNGIAALSNGDFEKSLSALVFAKYLRPKRSIVYRYLAEVNVAMGEMEDAIINQEQEKEMIAVENGL